MRRFIVNIVVEHLAAGHDATIMGATLSDSLVAYHRIKEALDDLGIKINSWGPEIKLANGARVQFGQLTEYTGASFLHTPLLVLVNVRSANLVLVPDARAIACCFPDGKQPIVIEC